MNFLQLVQEVNILSGIQGTIDDPASTVGIQNVIVDCTRNGWTSIQICKKDWEFMLRPNAFNTVPGQSVYTPDEVFADLGYNDLGLYKADSFAYEKRYLKELPVSMATVIDPSDSVGSPMWYFVFPYNNVLAINEPNGSYHIKFWYIKATQQLHNGTDIPELPERFHRLIIYKALEFLAVYTGNPELSTKYSLEQALLFGELMREYIPARRVYPRGIA